MIAWNSQMALDARQHLFFTDASPERIWKVTSSEDKTFILKLYRVREGTDAVRSGHYIESKHYSEDPEFDPTSPESGTEWAFLETNLESFLAHYRKVEEITPTKDESTDPR